MGDRSREGTKRGEKEISGMNKEQQDICDLKSEGALFRSREGRGISTENSEI